jgi:hypothetical protein
MEVSGQFHIRIVLSPGKIARYPLSAGLESREYSRGDLLRWPRDTLNRQKAALTSPTRGDRSVGIVRSRTKAAEERIIQWETQ